ncbi:Aste57867_8842 [Aphanomyces stellatus]|uniref:Aste57867_8842 protein n=1 Tax=Aphanomyces stellatus TaxID=120398 RepID=A0A485KLP6_9STRA|nr:hypothetical protein As57867_008807 [Aphanomyces stellatus]VFT85728.1 Aste57867_8842 [Aphanomyces stellatus]
MGRSAPAILKGVKCIVDVRMSAGDVDVDCSPAVSKKLEGLGAKVVKRLGRDTTHVVWLNGSRNVREDTLKRGNIKLVGPLWVEACAQTATRVPETKFFPVDSATTKGTPLPTPAAEKRKRRRSSLMEPRREDVFDELTTPIKKSRRQTLEPVTPVSMTLTPLEAVKTRRLSLRRASTEFSDHGSATPVSLTTVEEAIEPSAEPEMKKPTRQRKSVEPAPAPVQPASKTLSGWSCVSCTFENKRHAKKCTMCGTSSTGGKPEMLTASMSTDAATPKKTRLATAASSASPRPSLPRKATPPIFGKAKGPEKRPAKQTLSPSIPTVKAAKAKKTQVVDKTKPKTTRAEIKEAIKPTTKEGPKKALATKSKTVVEVAAKESAKRKSALTTEGRQVKPKEGHTNVEPKTKPAPKASTKKEPVKAAVAPPAKRSTRFVMSISGANLDTRMVLESTMREVDACSPGDGKSRIVDDMAAVVTHVVVSDKSKRTMKILFGLAQGAWIVSDAWVFSSLEAKAWLDVKDFLLYPVSAKKPPKLLDGKRVYIGSGLEPPKSTLQALVTAAGGQVCTQVSQSDVCIGVDAALGRRAMLAKVPMVSPKWLFDSLAAGELQPTPVDADAPPMTSNDEASGEA